MTIAQIDALIAAINDNGRNTALEVRTILTAIKNEAFPLNEIKMIFMTDLEITANFDSTGLGIGNSVGKAIANGLNGTENYSRKVPVGYDSTTYVSGFDYSQVSNTFGSENHTLTEAQLPIIQIMGHTNVAGETAGGGSGAQPYANGVADTIGGGLSHNNIQPSKVTLFIQRIS